MALKMCKLFTLLLVLLALSPLQASNSVILQLNNLPAPEIKQVETEFNTTPVPEKMKEFLSSRTPSQAALSVVNAKIKTILTPGLSGFPAVYSGYCDISDKFGRIQFPLRHTKSKIYLAITQDFSLIKTKGQTFSREEFVDNSKVQVKIYAFERKTDDKNREFWHVTQEKKPDTKLINQLSIVLLGNPDNFFVPEDDFQIFEKSEHMALPEIYVIGSADKDDVLMHFMDIKIYFERIKEEKKHPTDNVIQSIQQVASLKLLKSQINFF